MGNVGSLVLIGCNLALAFCAIAGPQGFLWEEEDRCDVEQFSPFANRSFVFHGSIGLRRELHANHTLITRKEKKIKTDLDACKKNLVTRGVTSVLQLLSKRY